MSKLDAERIPPELRHRVPPGQTLTQKWPVLHYSGIPMFMDMSKWQFRVFGEVDHPFSLSWDEFRSLPSVRRTSDFHCVTTWSRLDNRWEGVLFATLAERAKARPQARYAMLHSFDGYYTNVPLSWLMADDVLFAWSHDEKPLSEEHGGPLRLVVPKLYAWKSAKWVGGIEFMNENKRGFWEERGYHNRGEPFLEERYSYQETEETRE
ncbi:MAG: sulfite oxidase-like oxidoreductase [Myxococcales bacterium]|nr:sulfite oxidase-like oxidoreductase [Myxococcales bacterium]